MIAQERRLADEVAGIEFDGKRQAGRERIDRFAQFVTVERHRRFEAQRVASAQPTRRQTHFLAVGDQPVPDVRAVGGRDHDLEAVFARVSRPADEGRPAEDHRLAAGIVLEVGNLDVDVRVQNVECPRPLHGQHEGRDRLVLDVRVERALVPRDPVDDLEAVRGVHHEVVERVEAIDEHVVEHSARLVGHE